MHLKAKLNISPSFMITPPVLWGSQAELDGVEVPLHFEKIRNLKGIAVTKGGGGGVIDQISITMVYFLFLETKRPPSSVFSFLFIRIIIFH